VSRRSIERARGIPRLRRMTATEDSSDQSSDDTLDGDSTLDVVRLPPGDRSLAGTMQEGGDFIFAELAGVDLTEADFYRALFHDTVLERALMVRCDLRGAVFNEANLRYADLSHANAGIDNLGGSTDFIEADLSGADLRDAGARLRGAQLTGAVYDSATVFPRGFKPAAAGMVASRRNPRKTDDAP